MTHIYEAGVGAAAAASRIELDEDDLDKMDCLELSGDMGLAVVDVGVRPPLRDRSMGDAAF